MDPADRAGAPNGPRCDPGPGLCDDPSAGRPCDVGVPDLPEDPFPPPGAPRLRVCPPLRDSRRRGGVPDDAAVVRTAEGITPGSQRSAHGGGAEGGRSRREGIRQRQGVPGAAAVRGAEQGAVPAGPAPGRVASLSPAVGVEKARAVAVPERSASGVQVILSAGLPGITVPLDSGTAAARPRAATANAASAAGRTTRSDDGGPMPDDPEREDAPGPGRGGEAVVAPQPAGTTDTATSPTTAHPRRVPTARPLDPVDAAGVRLAYAGALRILPWPGEKVRSAPPPGRGSGRSARWAVRSPEAGPPARLCRAEGDGVRRGRCRVGEGGRAAGRERTRHGLRLQ